MGENTNNLDGKLIDETIHNLKKNYIDKVAEIVDLPIDTDEEKKHQRQSVIDWVTNPTNNVKVIIAFSGGKDSVSMVLYALHELNIPKENIELWHHDVDGHGENLFDWACTPSYCQAFADALGLRLIFSYANGGILREMYRKDETIQSIYYQQEPGGTYIELPPRGWPSDKNTRMKFPAVGADLGTRWCSWIAKISVMNKAINNWPKYSSGNICIMTGERREESNNRAKYKEVEKYRSMTETRRAIQWRPIIDWSEKQVWDIIEKHKIQPHPCYELGWGRCSCQMCIFSSANTWASLQEISPDKVGRIVEIEKDLGHSLYNEYEKVPTDKVWKTGPKKGMPMFTKGRKLDNVYEAKVKLGKSFISQETKDRWVNEALGEFTSPIFVEDWKLPAGAFNAETSGAD